MSRREAIGQLAAIGIGLTSASTVLAACRPSGNPKPNIVVIIADDMRYDHLQFMPNVQSLIQAPGRTFTQGRCNVPLCQPSRVGLMTGQMSKHNNELHIGFNGTALTDNNNCLGKWIRDAGYRCGYFGKYVNFWDGVGGIDAPEGYSTWRELVGASDGYEFDVHLNTGTTHVSGTYETDYLADEFGAFVAGSEPFFAIVGTRLPHAPFNPPTEFEDDWLSYDWPIVDEVDVSDKPSWIQALPAMTEENRLQVLEDVRGTLRELLAVDAMIARLIDSIASVLPNTIVVFTSDNGVHQGEHRRYTAAKKSGPYDVTLRVPLLVRGPGFAPGPDVTAPVMVFQDLCATLLASARGTAGLPNQSGVPLNNVVLNPATHAQRVLLHEIGNGYVTASGNGMTTGPDHTLGFRKLYRYPSVRQAPTGPFTYEAYDLDTDPDEFSNWAGDETRRGERDVLEAELNALLA